MKREVIEAIAMLAKEKSISKEVLFNAIEEALKSAYKKNLKKSPVAAQNVRVSIDREDGTVQVFARKVVTDDVLDDSQEITLKEARAIQPSYEIGDIVEIEVTPRDFGRVAAQTAKQVIVQRIREAERGIIYDEYIEKENEILTAIVQRVEGKSVFVELGKTEGMLDPGHHAPGEEYAVNDRLKVYVLEGQRPAKGPQGLVSRTHPGLVKRLFELEVPEIQTGVVQIKSIAREADKVIYTQAGPEISVASTKAMCSQLALLILMAVYWGQKQGILSPTLQKQIIDELQTLPQIIEDHLTFFCFRPTVIEFRQFISI